MECNRGWILTKAHILNRMPLDIVYMQGASMAHTFEPSMFRYQKVSSRVMRVQQIVFTLSFHTVVAWIACGSIYRKSDFRYAHGQ